MQCYCQVSFVRDRENTWRALISCLDFTGTCPLCFRDLDDLCWPSTFSLQSCGREGRFNSSPMSTVFKRGNADSLSAGGIPSSISSAASFYQQPSCAIAAGSLTDEDRLGGHERSLDRRRPCYQPLTHLASGRQLDLHAEGTAGSRTVCLSSPTTQGGRGKPGDIGMSESQQLLHSVPLGCTTAHESAALRPQPI